MKFKPSTHQDFELEAIQDGQLFLIGYLGTPEEFREYAKKPHVFPYIFEIDMRDMTSISRTPGFLTWQTENPGWTAVEDADELVKVVVDRVNRKELDGSSMVEFINQFKFGLKSELNIYNGFEVKRVSREAMSYDNFYQGVKLI